ncbi:hypothetical protein K443DRAFT_5817 [Laccaria amethystina LaAM-08-1]|uniref:Uncharacterized protein n=1 Tax=Laccaria amethystina LaAM-08-1 TaxID=1095629 RepID=A0A0C9XD18_9AGAR|nr:hypothetical protein K443DRAFT_5817 [Laccaria amethystina LaAM-08-1]
MSEGHANLFASAVPANESSSTIGSAGDQRGANSRSTELRRTSASEEIGNEQREPLSTGEDGDERFARPSTPDDERDDNQGSIDGDGQSLEQESIDLMDDIVENFRSKGITKLKALSNIISILDFNPSRSEQAKDAAVEYYSRMLNEINALATSAFRWGEHAQRSLQHTGKPNVGSKHVRNEQRDADVNELLSQISNESKQSRRPSSQDFIDDDDTNSYDLVPSEVQSNKKRRVHESDMPWFTREEEVRRTGNKDCKESRRTLALFARDHKTIKQWIQTSRTAPLGFPGSEWDNIIKGQAVNLDAMLSSLHP